MAKARFMFISDSHLATYAGSAVREDGANQRLLDVVDALDFFLIEAVKCGVTTVIHCGDFFHDRKAVKPEVLYRAGEWLDRCRSTYGIPLHLLVGNHDLSITGLRASSVRALAGSATIHDDAEVVEIDGVKVGFLPYGEDPEQVRTQTKFLARKGATVLVGHLGIGDPKFADCVPVDYEVPGTIAMSDLRPDDFQRVFLGHYHRAQDLTPRCHYIGSPLQLSLKEANQTKRAIVWSPSSDKATDVENDRSPQYRLAETAKEAAAFDAKDFVVVRAKTREEAEAAMVLATERGNMRVDRVPPPASKTRIDTSLPDRDLVAAYVDTHEVPEDERDDIVRLGTEILSHATRS